MEIKTIHDSLVNGNRKQMVNQINEYGTYDFWEDYRDYLQDCFVECGDRLRWFQDATISYFRIKENKR